MINSMLLPFIAGTVAVSGGGASRKLSDNLNGSYETDLSFTP